MCRLSRRSLPRARYRAVHLREHGLRHHGRGPGLGRVLQRHRQHLVGQPAPAARPPRAVSRALLGARQRDVRRLADRQPRRPRLRQAGPRLRDGHEAHRSLDRADRLRAERLERVGRDRAERHCGVHRLPQHPPLHRLRRPLRHGVPVAPGGAGGADLRGPHRAGGPHQHIAHPIHIAFDEWNVWCGSAATRAAWAASRSATR